MPNARHVLSWRPGHRDDWASTASGGICMSPPLGQKPWGRASLRLREPYHFETQFVLMPPPNNLTKAPLLNLESYSHGYLMRTYGLACDNLLSVDVVTADGQLLTASATAHADLFWAVRGGGGNFGVVTAFEYQLHPVSQLLGGLLVYPLA